MAVESEEPSDTVNVDVDVVCRRVTEVNGFKKAKSRYSCRSGVLGKGEKSYSC